MRVSNEFPLCLLAILSGMTAGVAEDVPILRADLSEIHLREESAYFDVFIANQKVGWMSRSLGQRKFDGEDVYAIEMQFVQKLLNDGQSLTVTSLDQEYFSVVSPYPFVAATSTTKQNGFESETRIRRKERGAGKFVATIVGGKIERDIEIGELDYTLGDSLAGIVWCGRELVPGDSVWLRELDFTDLEVRAAVHTIRRVLPADGEGSMSRCGLRGKYEIEYFDPVDKTRATFITDAAGKLLGGKIGGAVELRLTSAEAARNFEAKLDLFESSLIRIDTKLGDPSDIRAMVMEITGEGIGMIKDSANQDADYDADAGRLLLKIGRQHGQRIAITDQERREALRETSAYPTKDPEVIALTESALGRATRPKARIKRLVDFVDDFITDDYSNEPLSVNDIINTQRGDCTEHSQLFVTMARAAGIPAREVSGFIYGEDSDLSFGGHSWCEIEVDGHWHPVDPTWGETVINATHIRISGERTSSAEMDLYLGGIQFRILSVTDRKGRERRLARPSKAE